MYNIERINGLEKIWIVFLLESYKQCIHSRKKKNCIFYNIMILYYTEGNYRLDVHIWGVAY